jgi:hypothetical protein
VAGAALALGMAAAVACAAGPATAGGPGSWSDVTGDTGTNLTQVDATRGEGGALWIAFARESGTDDDLVVRSISPSGSPGALTVVQAGWDIINNPAIVRLTTGELRVFFSGMRSTSPSDPYDGLTDSTSATGASWALRTAPPVVFDDQTSGSVAYAADVDAVVTPGGTAFQTWSGAGSGPVWVHRGYSASPAAQHDLMTQLGGGSGYYAAVESDRASGDVWAAWMVLDGALEGVYAQRVDPASSAPVGVAQRLTGTHPLSLLSSKVQMTGRAGGQAGVYVACPIGGAAPKKVRLWHLGDPTTFVDVAGGTSTKEHASVAADGKGRVWVLWSESSGDRDVIYAKRSNPSVTRFGAVVSVKTPSGVPYLYHLTANASDARLDVLAHLGGNGEVATYQTQVQPGLSATVSPSRIRAGGRRTVTVKVTDAGVPVSGAGVKGGGTSATTNASGTAKLKVGPYRGAKVLKFSVKRSGFVGTSVKVSVRR